jgi:hypothetical protein
MSIVCDYRLDDQGSIPGESKRFSSSLCIQTSSEAQQASYPMGTAIPLPIGYSRVMGIMTLDTSTSLPTVIFTYYLCQSAHSSLTLWSRRLSKCYLRIQFVPQREHDTSPLKISWLMLFKEIISVLHQESY